MENNNLTINTQVLEQMASMAALEVDGVASMASGPVDIRAIKNGKLAKSAVVTERNGAVTLDLYIKIKENSHAGQVAEAVQKSVREKLQSMTGSAITTVNVIVADVQIAAEA